MKNSKAFNYFLILITSLFWGLSFIVMNFALRKLEPIQVIAARWTLAALIFLVLIGMGKIRIKLRTVNLKYILLTGLMEPGLYAIFETYGLKYSSASVSSIFIATIPVMCLIQGFLFFHRRTNWKGVLSIFIALTGVTTCTVFSPDFSAEGRLTGYLFLFMAVVLGGLFGFFSAKASETYSSMEITCVMAFTGCIIHNLLCLVLGYGGSTYTILLGDKTIAAAILFLGVFCSIICYAAFNQVLSAMDVSLVNNMSGSLITVVGVIAGVLVDGDPSGLYLVIGLAVTLFGVWLSSRAAAD